MEKSAPFNSTVLPASSSNNNCIFWMFTFSKYLRTSDAKSPFALFAQSVSPKTMLLGRLILAMMFLFWLVFSCGETNALAFPCENSLSTRNKCLGVLSVMRVSDKSPVVVKLYDVSLNPSAYPKLLRLLSSSVFPQMSMLVASEYEFVFDLKRDLLLTTLKEMSAAKALAASCKLISVASAAVVG